MLEIDEAMESAFDGFIQRVEPFARRSLAAYGIPSEDGEDMLQQALLAILYQWERFEDSEQAAKCLSKILVSHCSMYQWRSRRTENPGSRADGTA